jgi:hypothetical protein
LLEGGYSLFQEHFPVFFEFSLKWIWNFVIRSCANQMVPIEKWRVRPLELNSPVNRFFD